MTMAEQIAARLGNTGTQFYVEARPGEPTDNGAPRDGMTGLAVLAKAAGGRAERKDDLKRWLFADGSAITVAPGGWDLGFATCWCWQGEGHAAGCTRGQA